jgi:putative ABC transport system substrate-binding protein
LQRPQGGNRRVCRWSGGSASAPTRSRDGLWQGLRELGYVDGKNIAFEYRFPQGNDAGFAGSAKELVRQKVDILAPAVFPATDAVRRATSAIPVLFVVADPIGSKFAESLAHPAGT